MNAITFFEACKSKLNYSKRFLSRRAYIDAIVQETAERVIAPNLPKIVEMLKKAEAEGRLPKMN